MEILFCILYVPQDIFSSIFSSPSNHPMFQRMVAQWLRQQAQDVVLNALNPDDKEEDSGPTSAGKPRSADVACFFPSAGEAGGFVDQLNDISKTQCAGFLERLGKIGKISVAVVEGNLPQDELARCVLDVLRLRQPKWIFASGFAVSLNNEVKRGSILVGDRITNEHNYALATGTKMAADKGVHVGTVLSRVALPSPIEKKELAATTPALAAETQAAVIAEVSRLQKCPMMSIHLVAQGLDERPSNILDQVKSQKSIAGIVGAAAGALLDRPSSVMEFWNDKEATLRYSDRLAKFLVGVITQLPISAPEAGKTS